MGCRPTSFLHLELSLLWLIIGRCTGQLSLHQCYQCIYVPASLNNSDVYCLENATDSYPQHSVKTGCVRCAAYIGTDTEGRSWAQRGCIETSNDFALVPDGYCQTHHDEKRNLSGELCFCGSDFCNVVGVSTFKKAIDVEKEASSDAQAGSSVTSVHDQLCVICVKLCAILLSLMLFEL